MVYAVEDGRLAYVHNCDLAGREGGGECRSVSFRADCVDGARENTILTDREGLQTTDWGNFVDRAGGELNPPLRMRE